MNKGFAEYLETHDFDGHGAGMPGKRPDSGRGEGMLMYRRFLARYQGAWE